MADTKKFKITISQIIEQEFEMTLEDDSIVKALDEARRLVEVRNQHSKTGTYFVTKIETEE